MIGIDRVVIPIDDTEASKIATEQAAYFAKLLKVELSIISVNEARQYMISKLLESKIKQEKLQLLDEIKKIAEKKGINVTTRLILGSPADEIINYTNEKDLIVMPSHENKGYKKFFLGNVSEEVLERAPCNVMIIRPKKEKK